MGRIEGPVAARDLSVAKWNSESSHATVKAGETRLLDVARRLGVNLEALAQANPRIKDPNHLKPGQEIRLPRAQTPSVRPDRTETSVSPVLAQASTGCSLGVQPGEPAARSMVQARMFAAAKPTPALPSAPGGSFGLSLEPTPKPDCTPFYTGIPVDSEGRLLRMGSGTLVKSWMEDVLEFTESYAGQITELKTAITEFDAAESKARGRLEAAIKKDIPKGVDALPPDAQRDVGQLIHDYRTERRNAQQSLCEQDMLAKKADVALLKCGIAETDLRGRTLQLERDALSVRAAAMEATIAKTDAVVDKVVDYGLGLVEDPKAFAKDVLKDLTKYIAKDVFTEETRTALIAVKGRMDEVDAKLSGLTDQQYRTELQAARMVLEASTEEILLAESKHRHHASLADSKLDRLVDIEKQYNRTSVFEAMRDYNTQMTRAGRAVWKEAGESLALVDSALLGKAAEMHARVESDRKHVQASDAPEPAKEKFLAESGQIQQYVEDVQGWAEDQRGALRKVREDLERGNHLALVGETIDTIITKAFEGLEQPPDTDYLRRY